MERMEGMVENVDRREKKMNIVLAEQIEQLEKEVKRMLEEGKGDQMSKV